MAETKGVVVPPLVVTRSDSSSLHASDGGRNVRKATSKKSFQQLVRTWGIEDEPLIQLFSVYYRKPYNSKGTLYVFPNYLGFVSHTSTQVCRSFGDVTHMEVKKGNHSPKQFLFIRAGSPEILHKIRGRAGSQRRMAATVLLVWQRFKGDTSIDLAMIKSDSNYIKQHPAVKQMTEGLDADIDTGELDDTDSDSELESPRPLTPPSPTTTDQAPIESPEQTRDNISPSATATPTPTPTSSSDLPPKLNALPQIFRTALSEQKGDNDFRECIVAYDMERVWAVLFSDRSTIIKDFTTEKGAYDWTTQSWTNNGEYLERKLTYSKPVESRIISGTANVTQVQRACLVAGKLIVYNESSNTGIPKSDCFISKSVYEVSSNAGSAKIRYTAWIDWIKSGGILKGPITSKTLEAIFSSFEGLMMYAEQHKDSVLPPSSPKVVPAIKPMALARSQDRSDHLSPRGVPEAQTPKPPPSERVAQPTKAAAPTDPVLIQPVATSVATQSINGPASASATPTPTFSISGPKPSASSAGFLSLSPLELVLLLLLVLFMCTTFYYRAQANSLAFILHERNEALAAAHGGGMLPPLPTEL